MSKDLDRLYAGKLYCTDDKIKAMKTKGRALIREFNQTLFLEEDKRRKILKELFGKMGEDVTVRISF